MSENIRNSIIGITMILLVIAFYNDVFNIGSISTVIGSILLIGILVILIYTHKLLLKIDKILRFQDAWSYEVKKDYGGIYWDEIEATHVEFPNYKVHFDNINDFGIFYNRPTNWRIYPLKVTKKEEKNANYEGIEHDEPETMLYLKQQFKCSHPQKVSTPIANFVLALSSFPFFEKIQFGKDKIKVELDLPFSTKSDTLEELLMTLEEFLPYLDKEWKLLLESK